MQDPLPTEPTRRIVYANDNSEHEIPESRKKQNARRVMNEIRSSAPAASFDAPPRNRKGGSRVEHSGNEGPVEGYGCDERPLDARAVLEQIRARAGGIVGGAPPAQTRRSRKKSLAVNAGFGSEDDAPQNVRSASGATGVSDFSGDIFSGKGGVDECAVDARDILRAIRAREEAEGEHGGDAGRAARGTRRKSVANTGQRDDGDSRVVLGSQTAESVFGGFLSEIRDDLTGAAGLASLGLHWRLLALAAGMCAVVGRLGAGCRL